MSDRGRRIGEGVEDAERAATAVLAAAKLAGERLRDGGRLAALGRGRCYHDACHVAVEFLHPVIAGKRAIGAWAGRTEAPPAELAIGIGYGRDPLDPQAIPGWIDIAITDQESIDAPVVIPLAAFRTPTPKQAAVTAYHLLWETAHLYLDRAPSRPVSESDPASGSGDTIAQLYPMLYDSTDDAGRDRAATESVGQKLAESAASCEAALSANRRAIDRAAGLLAGAGTVFTCGNGGSATDAADLAEALGPRGWCLSSDVAAVTALTNDVGFHEAFARPLRSLAEPGDVAIGISTSGTSANVLTALAEARSRGLRTIALVGYGGTVAAEPDVDVVLAVDSPSVHRIQEAQVALCAELMNRLNEHPTRGGRHQSRPDPS